MIRLQYGQVLNIAILLSYRLIFVRGRVSGVLLAHTEFTRKNVSFEPHFLINTNTFLEPVQGFAE